MDPQNSESSRRFDPTRHVSSLWEEFRAFAFKGNVIDLAVGVVIGAAFGKLVDSLVKHVIMPLVTFVLPTESSYQTWSLTIGEQEVPYGLFLAEVVNFLIVALALFLFIKKFLSLVIRQKQKEAEAPAPTLTKDQELLMEIRDLLRERPA